FVGYLLQGLVIDLHSTGRDVVAHELHCSRGKSSHQFRVNRFQCRLAFQGLKDPSEIVGMDSMDPEFLPIDAEYYLITWMFFDLISSPNNLIYVRNQTVFIRNQFPDIPQDRLHIGVTEAVTQDKD